jgi:7-keto-8-aminopelargonate synthetase-like enzyme
MNTSHDTLDVITPMAPRRRATGRWALVEHQRRLHQNAALFLNLAREAGIDTGEHASDLRITCIVGSPATALRLSDALMRRGIHAEPIIFPAAPEDQARLRFFVTSCHSEDQIRSTVEALAEELALLHAGS